MEIEFAGGLFPDEIGEWKRGSCNAWDGMFF